MDNINSNYEKYYNQALMLSNKVKKQYKHFNKRYAKQNIEIFRLYDWNIPEIAVVVDWYAGHIVIAEYVKKNSDPCWLPIMAESCAKALDIDIQNVHIKKRYAGYKDGNRYERIAHIDKKIIMSERDLKFYINLDDYVDTGLFSDHRNTRLMLREMVKGKDFLNLYCYTGSFSCCATKGGAKTTTSVDRSESAIKWTKDNMELNRIGFETNKLIKAHTFDFLEKAKKKGQLFDTAVVDPPSFSSSREINYKDNQNSTDDQNNIKNVKYHFDIAQDHPLLLKEVIQIMRKNSNSVIFFSTNHQKFKLNIDKIMDINNKIDIKEITSITIPDDYKTHKKQIHRCWKIVVL